jgi:hypothetical protein
MDQAAIPPKKPGTFVSGYDPRRVNAHRKKGSVNKFPTDLRRDVVAGLAQHGSDGKGTGGFQGYVFWLASKYPKQAARIIERILPLTVNGSGLGASAVGTINVVSLPSNTYLSPDMIAKLSPGSVPLLEHEPIDTSTPAETNSPAPVPIDQDIKPQNSTEEAALVAELEALPVDELMRRAEELTRKLGVHLAQSG